MIQSDDPVVCRLAKGIDHEETDAWRLSVSIEKYVHRSVRQKNFSTAFATAAEVARSLQGDCTEHAVLTAALCRARKIPARIVVGLIYVAAERGFVFHMWNEVWIDGAWIPVDSTLGIGGIGAAHLTLASSAFEAERSFASLLPVVQVMGQLELEILAVD